MNNVSGPYKLAVFDVDGTLIDTEQTGVLSLVRTIKELIGRDVPYDEARGFFGIPSHRVAGMLGYEDNAVFGRRWEENFVELSYLIAPFPGVRGMLEKVKSSGILTGIVTSRSRFEFEYDTHLNKMLDLIDVTVCADDTVRHKPDPDPLLECISRASVSAAGNIDPSECLYLGDTAHDWKCAHAAGCDFALADWKKRGMQGIDANYHFTDSDGALEILGCHHL